MEQTQFQDRILRVKAVDGLECHRPIAGRNSLKTMPLQTCGELTAKEFVIVDNQDFVPSAIRWRVIDRSTPGGNGITIQFLFPPDPILLIVHWPDCPIRRR
jgi:hypothetical protein